LPAGYPCTHNVVAAARSSASKRVEARLTGPAGIMPNRAIVVLFLQLAKCLVQGREGVEHLTARTHQHPASDKQHRVSTFALSLV